MGTWIAIAITLFALGTIMALKPSVIEVRLDKLRMTARKLDLNPKLIDCPDWLLEPDQATVNQSKMQSKIGQYAIILDDMKFPEAYYQVVDGHLRHISSFDDARLDNASIAGLDRAVAGSGHSSKSVVKHGVSHNLNAMTLSLPSHMAPLIKGVYTKANSLVVFWQDSGYVRPTTNPNFTMEQIEPDLLTLKSTMQALAQKLAS